MRWSASVAFSFLAIASCIGRTELDTPDPSARGNTAPTVTAPGPRMPAPSGTVPPTGCECVRGEISELPCDGDAYQRRSCDDGCHFSAWSSCAVRGWLPMSSPRPLGLVLGAPRIALWTGHEMFFWSGVPAIEYPDTAAYDPATDRWRLLPHSPIITPVWSTTGGSLSVVVEGRVWILPPTDADPTEPTRHFDVFDPITNEWSRRDVKGFTPRVSYSLSSLTWVPATRELVALGGAPEPMGFAFRPDDDMVRLLKPTADIGDAAVWSAPRLWICCRGETPDPTSFDAWDPISNTWTTRDDVPAAARFSSMLVLPGASAPSVAFVMTSSDTRGDDTWSGTMWGLNDDTFSPIAPPSADVLPFPGRAALLWSSDREVFVWGGTADTIQTGATYDVATRRWRAMPPGGPSIPDAVTVWTGDVEVLFGGDLEGRRYRP